MIYCMTDTFVTAAPKSEFLKKFISYYYFHESGDDTSVKTYLFYPHYRNALSIYSNASTELAGRFYVKTKPSKQDFSYNYSKLTKYATKSEIYPPFNKVGIVFEALGLNNFIDSDLSDIVLGPINTDFNYFKPSMDEVNKKVFLTKDIEEKVELLDAYFLSQYVGFDNPVLEKTIELILNGDKRFSVEKLAEQIGVNRKTLLRAFKKHLNCTVIDYVKLVHFRKALENSQDIDLKNSLTQLALSNNYYDQSEFIHHFKIMTGFKPMTFFKNLSKLGEHGTFWTFD